MKTMKNLLIVAVLLTTLAGYAEELRANASVRIFTKLEFADVKKGHQLTLKDDRGIVLHREVIKSNGDYSKAFDLTALDDGYYTIELDKDYEIVIKPFNIQSKRVMFLTNQETKVFKPVVRLENSALLISQLSLEDEPLKVELYYNNEIIHEEELSGDKILQRIYGLSKTEKGYYHIVMTSGDRTFTQGYKL